MLVCPEIFPFLLSSFISATRAWGSPWVPMSFPFMYTLASILCTACLSYGLDPKVVHEGLYGGVAYPRRELAGEGQVLHQAAVWPLGSFAGAYPPELGGMEVPGLEVGLGAGEGGYDPPQMGDDGEVVRPVQELGDPCPPPYPVPRGQGVPYPLRQDVAPHRRLDGGLLPPPPGP